MHHILAWLDIVINHNEYQMQQKSTRLSKLMPVFEIETIYLLKIKFRKTIRIR